MNNWRVTTIDDGSRQVAPHDGPNAYRLHLLNQPIRNVMPAVNEIQVPLESDMGLSVEGSERFLPDSPRGQSATTKYLSTTALL
jgi:hypothetical protein